MEYLERIDRLHDTWLSEDNKETKILTIDANKEFEMDEDY